MALKELGRSSTLAWCPFKEKSNMLALGGIGLDSPQISLCSFDLADKSSKEIDLCASVQIENIFKCIAWGVGKHADGVQTENTTLGVIAGGMQGGNIQLFNPAAILKSKGVESGIIYTINAYKYDTSCIQFNPHRGNLIASGGDEGLIKVIDCNQPNDMDIYKPNPHKETSNMSLRDVSWNTCLSHILASASNLGVTTIWDLKQQKSALSFIDRNSITREASTISWLSANATQLVVGYEDDESRYGGFELWDLRYANYPIKSIQNAHFNGAVMHTCFNFFDNNILLTCGKDNRILTWSIINGSPELHTETVCQQWCFQAKFSPFHPPIFACASHNDYTAINSLHNVTNSFFNNNNNQNFTSYVPKWLSRNCGVSSGFGGKFVVFEKNKPTVKCYLYPSDSELVMLSRSFEEILRERNFEKFCEQKIKLAGEANNRNEKLLWKMTKIFFTQEGRNRMVDELGFESKEILRSIENYLGHPLGLKHAEISNQQQNQNFIEQNDYQSFNEIDPEKFFKELGEKTEAALLAKQNVEKVKQAEPSKGQSQEGDWNNGALNLIKKSVLIGDIKAAVELCIKKGRMADALLLASYSNDSETWNYVKNMYLASQNDSFLKMIGCIINSKFSEMIRISDLNLWEEALAILCTYCPAESFKTLCEELACRLEKEKNDKEASLVCYVCACNFNETVRLLSELSISKDLSKSSSIQLQKLVENMAVLKIGMQFTQYDSTFTNALTKYAEILANSGNITEAMRFLCLINEDVNMQSAYLRDRIYNSSPSRMNAEGIQCPPTPFDLVNVVSVAPRNQAYVQNNKSVYNEHNITHRDPTSSAVGATPFYPSDMIAAGQSIPPLGSQVPPTAVQHNPYSNMPPSGRIMPPTPLVASSSPAVHKAPVVPSMYGGSGVGGVGGGVGGVGGGVGGVGGGGAASSVCYPNNNFNYGNEYYQPPSNPHVPGGPPAMLPTFPPPSACPPIPRVSIPNSIPNSNQPVFSQFPPSNAPQYMNSVQQVHATPPHPHPGSFPPPPSLSSMNRPQPLMPQSTVAASFPPANNNIPITPSQPSWISSSIPAAFSASISSSKQLQPARLGGTPMATPHGGGANYGVSAATPPQNLPAAKNTSQDPSSVVYATQNSTLIADSSLSQTMSSFGLPQVSRVVTAPTAGAAPVKPGMPVPWPIPTTTQQLGSATVSTAEANYRVHAAAVAPQQQGVPMSSNDLQYAMKILNQLISLQSQQDSNSKRVEDLKKRIEELYEKLSKGAISRNISERVLQLCNCIERGDFVSAQKVHMDLSTSEWDSQNKNWLMGLKRLLPK